MSHKERLERGYPVYIAKSKLDLNVREAWVYALTTGADVCIRDKVGNYVYVTLTEKMLSDLLHVVRAEKANRALGGAK